MHPAIMAAQQQPLPDLQNMPFDQGMAGYYDRGWRSSELGS